MKVFLLALALVGWGWAIAQKHQLAIRRPHLEKWVSIAYEEGYLDGELDNIIPRNSNKKLSKKFAIGNVMKSYDGVLDSYDY